ncbi:hypothetical protein SUGI_0236160 [Cryptomeria japonica]|nr:hypothetical protein SUGI_0236160 [Cryptomeria japonica]
MRTNNLIAWISLVFMCSSPANGQLSSTFYDKTCPKALSTVKANCPSTGGDNNLSPLDVQSSTVFDNQYYINLRSQKGLLYSDQELFNGGSADSQVTITYSNNRNAFFSDFAAAMVNMGNISPLTGTNGEVRLNCRKPN